MYKKLLIFLFIFLFIFSFAVLTRHIWIRAFSQNRVNEAFEQSRSDLEELENVNGDIREKLQIVTKGIGVIDDDIGRNGEIIEKSRKSIAEIEAIFEDCRKRIRELQEK